MYVNMTYSLLAIDCLLIAYCPMWAVPFDRCPQPLNGKPGPNSVTSHPPPVGGLACWFRYVSTPD